MKKLKKELREDEGDEYVIENMSYHGTHDEGINLDLNK